VLALVNQNGYLNRDPLSDWQPVKTRKTGVMCSDLLAPVTRRAAVVFLSRGIIIGVINFTC